MRYWAVLYLLLLFSCGSEKNEPLRIAVAANLAEGIDSLANYFEEIEKIECEVIIGASGELTTQIENGAPFDIFISADKSYAQRLYDQNLCNEPKLFLESSLVCINHSGIEASNPIELLVKNEVQRIGIADPDIAPFGKAAKNYLSEMGIWEDVEHKIVYGESVTHLNAMIESYSVDAALTNMSFLKRMEFVYPFYELEPSETTLIQQYMVQIEKADKNHPYADKFAEFLLSEEAFKILAYFGY